MKFTSLVIILMCLAVSSYASALTICANNVVGNGGKVELYNAPLMELSGFKIEGIQNGMYTCQVTSVLPVFLNTQQTIVCSRSSGEILTGVMLEGINFAGQHTATVSLYKNTTKIFMSSCVRAN
jgi:hypothetical protein